MTTLNNGDILLSSARLIEQSVINWTLESDTIGSGFAFGVDFTAPLDVVQETLVQVALQHSQVMDNPAPEDFLEHIDNDAGYLGFNLCDCHTMHSSENDC